MMSNNKLKKYFVQKAIILFLIICAFEISSLAAVGNEECVTLFSQSNFTGLNHTLKRDSVIPNLEEEYFVDANNPWNLTGSFSIKNGCIVEGCSGRYFDGICQDFNESQSSLPSQGLPSLLSLKCHCNINKECQWSEINVRKPACATGFLGTGCELYVEFKEEKDSFPEEVANIIRTVKIREGCSLTIYDQEEYEGDDEEFKWQDGNNFITNVLNWNESLKSYKCSCSNDELITTKPEVNVTRPSHYPTSIKIPNDIDGISRMINSNFKGHPGLVSALKSMKHKRSSNNAYILVLGTTGSGKSSTINLLFNNQNITLTGHGESTTSSILEFRIPIPVDKLGITNSEIRIIDTPGLGDTRGLEKDAKFLATLDKYLSNHEELSNRIPNAILIIHPFNDNRFSGAGSNFIKTLRGLDSFRNRITDETYSNVIFVLSHYNFIEKSKLKNPWSIVQEFKNVIQDFSLFPKPVSVILAENHNIPMKNGHYFLPNGDLYPQNLIERMKLAMSKGNDPIGKAIIETAFDQDHQQGSDFNVTLIEYPLLNASFSTYNSTISKYLSILAAANLNIETTKVSIILATTYASIDNPNLKQKYPGSLVYLQKALNMRNIQNVTDVPKTNLQIVELFSTLKINEMVELLLEKALSLNAPNFKDDLLTGKAYNVLKGITLTESPFVKRLEQQTTAEIGYTFPQSVSCSVANNVKDRFKIFRNKNDFVEFHRGELGVTEIMIKESIFIAPTPLGSNLLTSNSNDIITLTAVREYRTFKLDLNDDYKLTKMFSDSVNNLKPFNETSYDNVQQWKNFFLKYGTHVVHSVFGGGSIEIQVKTNYSSVSEMSRRIFDFIDFADKIELTKGTNLTGIQHTLTFKGGDSHFKTTDLTKMSVKDASDLLMGWRKSLHLQPEIIKSSIKVVSLNQILNKEIGQTASSSMQEGISRLFSGTLEYIPSKLLLAELSSCQAQKVQATKDFLNQTSIINKDIQKINEQITTLKGKMQEDNTKFMKDLLVLKGEETTLKATDSSKAALVGTRSQCEIHKMTSYPY